MTGSDGQALVDASTAGRLMCQRKGASTGLAGQRPGVQFVGVGLREAASAGSIQQFAQHGMEAAAISGSGLASRRSKHMGTHGQCRSASGAGL